MNFLAKLFRREKRLTLQEKFPEYEIGRHSYGHLKVRQWGNDATLRIGAFCSFADGVQVFLGGNHRTEWVTTFPFPQLWDNLPCLCGEATEKTRGDVTIGNDVWIGSGALIMSGVHVGDGAVIGARAVVTRDVPPYAIAVGVPARMVKKRFDDATIERLCAVSWWQWDDLKIRRYMPLLLSGETEAFLRSAEADASASLVQQKS